MITTEVNGHKIITWGSIDEMPINRYSAFNRYMMLSDGLGSSFSDIENIHIRPLVQILDDKKKAIQQISNLRELVFNLLNEVNFEHRAYCVLVHSIDGKELTGFSESDIDETIKTLGRIGVTHNEIKKKMTGQSGTVPKKSKGCSLINRIKEVSITITKKLKNALSLLAGRLFRKRSATKMK
jgi:hypothetical protein